MVTVVKHEWHQHDRQYAIEIDDEGMDSEHDNWRGQWSQFDVYHNAK